MVLVVDDDEETRRTTVSLLETFGVLACAAANGDEALALLPEVRPDVILCDLQMPGLDGFGFVRRLRRTPTFHRTLTVAVTGLSRPLDIAATREAGFDGHLVKPVTLEMVAPLLERVIHARRWTSQDASTRGDERPCAPLGSIRERVAAGSLPCEDCVVTWYGAGRGRLCAACDQPILSIDTEIECAVPAGGTIFFHNDCYDVWRTALSA